MLIDNKKCVAILVHSYKKKQKAQYQIIMFFLTAKQFIVI